MKFNLRKKDEDEANDKQINNPEHTIQEAKDTEIAGPLK